MALGLLCTPDMVGGSPGLATLSWSWQTHLMMYLNSRCLNTGPQKAVVLSHAYSPHKYQRREENNSLVKKKIIDLKILFSFSNEERGDKLRNWFGENAGKQVMLDYK